MKNLLALFDAKLWKFLLVGLLNTLVGDGLSFLLINLTDLNLWLATAAPMVLASVMSYFLNKHFTFRNTETGLWPACRFALNIAVCYLLAYGIAIPLMQAALSGSDATLRDNLSKLVGMCLFTGFNYLGQRLFAFREKA